MPEGAESTVKLFVQDGRRYREATRDEIITAFVESLPDHAALKVTRTLLAFAVGVEEGKHS